MSNSRGFACLKFILSMKLSIFFYKKGIVDISTKPFQNIISWLTAVEGVLNLVSVLSHAKIRMIESPRIRSATLRTVYYKNGKNDVWDCSNSVDGIYIQFGKKVTVG